MRFLLVNVTAEIHTHSVFMASLRRAFEEIGHEAVVSQQPIGDPNGLLRELLASKFDAVVSLSSVFGDAIVPEGASLFDVLDVKFIGWQLDHPIYVHHALVRPMRNRRSIYSNHNHQRFAGALGIQGAALSMLPGGEPQATPLKDYAARQWPILVAATWNGVPERAWEALEESPGKQLLVEIVGRLGADPEASVLDALNAATKHLGIDAALGVDPAFDAGIVELLRGALNYCRHADRISFVTSLADAGLPITICGPGWRDYLGDRKNVTYLEGRVNFADMAALYNNAKITLNLNAGNGACERAIYAMMSGAAVVSDFSGDLAQTFAAGDEIQFFNRARPVELVEGVGGLLESGRGEIIAARGHQRAMDSALWRHRAEALVAALS